MDMMMTGMTVTGGGDIMIVTVTGMGTGIEGKPSCAPEKGSSCADRT
jgi:hypothetical protein